MAEDQTRNLVEGLARAICACDGLDPDDLVSVGTPYMIASGVIVQNATQWVPAWTRHAGVASDLIQAGWRLTMDRDGR